MGTPGLLRAKRAKAQALEACIEPTLTTNERTFQFTIVTANALSRDQYQAVWDILELNMRDLYSNSSFGWKPADKKKEMSAPSSRYILVEQKPFNTVNESQDEPVESPPFPLVSYAMFRFEHENEEDVLYCYEVQVVQEFQRHGLGKALIQRLYSIASQWGMKKVMLTVFKVNENAVKFYESMGFTLDPWSPEHPDNPEKDEQDENETFDYIIMSKSV